ncbi:hypothetical protein CERSUDRAFT_116010 [Gelatoporia subvermispora B]|uniref:Alpha/beta hydrolase fold-3 domain-containing protein n=1 Tax=Ceriporiopsis subvermispora (strain B) TaxID=914234 RepID=M2RCH3_CERS8|nr:hypothetical protein CERSUDRAFT_116010 [Gelatoporia subvermispora B]
MSQYSHLAEVDPEFAPLRSQFPPIPDVIDAKVLRSMYDSATVSCAKKSWGQRLPPDSEYRVDDHQICVNDGKITLRCLVPTPQGTESQEYPLLYWMHGGGCCLGTIESDDYLLRILCVEHQISIVNVDYRLAPEYKFPTGLDDAYAGLKWAASHTSLLSASLSQGFIVGGTSAGGNLSAVMTHRARDDPFFSDKKITGQILMMPTVLHPDGYPDEYKSELLSFDQNWDAPLLSRADVRMLFGWIGAPNPRDPNISPLLYPSHKDLPPAYFQVCGLDPLRDEGLLYEKILKEAGVRTRLDIYPGVPHTFYLFTPDIKQAVKLEKDLNDGIRWLLQGGPGS